MTVVQGSEQHRYKVIIGEANREAGLNEHDEEKGWSCRVGLTYHMGALLSNKDSTNKL